MTTGSDSLVVAVIDSGVNVGHPDLQPNVDAANAFDFVNGNANVSDDTLNHGTLVASVIGSRGANGIGTTGVMQRVRILPLQVLNPDESLSTSAIVNAVGYARDKGARVVNMSFGHYGGTGTRRSPPRSRPPRASCSRPRRETSTTPACPTTTTSIRTGRPT